jgi:hypothetical protein
MILKVILLRLTILLLMIAERSLAQNPKCILCTTEQEPL